MRSHKRQIALLFIVALLCMLLPLRPSSSQADEITYIFCDEPIPPYTYGNEGENCQKGITKEIFDRIFSKLGLQYKIRLVPWARAIDSAQNGLCDGIPLLIKTDERLKYLRFTDPVVENRELLYYSPKRFANLQWNDFSELKRYRIGLIRGYTYSPELIEAINKHNIHVSYAKDSELNFRMLEAGRVDIIVEDETIANQLMASHPKLAATLTAAPKAISSYHWRIGIQSQSPLVAYIEAINTAIAEMHEDGSLASILDKKN